MPNSALSTLLILALSLTSLASNALENEDVLSPELVQSLEIDQDKITIIDFFASWCVSCRIELPQIAKLIPQLDAQQVEVIGINVDEEISEGQAYIDTFKKSGGLNFRVFMDPEQELIDIFEPLGMPALYYIQNGIVKKMHLGAMPNIDQVILTDLSSLGYLSNAGDQ
jgi:cytochrome c biogenesis protein CcmG, thiol:disulfide interchange protein DsbE